MKHISKIICAALFMIASTSFSQNAVSLDSISGFMAPNKLPIGQPITFPIRIEANIPPADGWAVFACAYDLYSPQGATWAPTTHMWAMNAATNALRNNWGTQNFLVNTYSLNGNSHDTIATLGTEYVGPPFGDIFSFNEVAFSFTTNGFLLTDTGKTFCIDSCSSWPPSLNWGFGGANLSGSYPATYGTGTYAANYTPGQGYCFTLAVPPYICGDVNNSGSVTVADLTYMIQYVFNNGPAIPNPWFRADVNCSRGIGPNVADNTYLVGYLFNHGPVPCANCPQ